MQNKYRYKITLEYLGAGFCGWQRQKKGIMSLQELIEEAIYKFSKEKVILYAAGRTDVGVNAYGQVAHFELNQKYDVCKVIQSINHFCKPYKVGVTDCNIVDENFHARFSAKQRHYVYKIINRKAVNIINSGLRCWIKDKLDVKAMQEAAAYLIGNHDFSSFRSSECQSKSPIKTLTNIQFVQNNEEIDIYFSAPSFLHHMVRNIVGTLVIIGKGAWQPEKVKEILAARNREQAGPMAQAEGLYFLKVDY